MQIIKLRVIIMYEGTALITKLARELVKFVKDFFYFYHCFRL